MGALRVLNSLLDGWATEQLLVYVIDRQVFGLVGNTASYTLGPGGTWNTTPLYGAGTPRPVRLEAVWYVEPSTQTELPVTLLQDHADYQALRAVPVAGTLPCAVFYEPSVPLGTVYVSPTPTGNGQMVCYLWHPWSTEQTLDTVLVLAPGYLRMLEYNLALDLASEYPGVLAGRDDLVAGAMESKSKVQTLNIRVPRMQTDIPMGGSMAGSGSLYSFSREWLSGGF
jgi:hypothetical protein